MSTLSQFAPGGKPRSITTYTSGSGTYTPSAPNAWCYVTLIGGGGASGNGSCCYSRLASGAGRSGLILTQWTKIVSTAAYSVGAGAYYYQAGTHPHYYTALQNAGNTTFNGLTAYGGDNGGAYSYGYSTDSPDASAFIRYLWRTMDSHGGNYGKGGAAGGSCDNSQNCNGSSFGGNNGQNGFILIQDFGP